MTGREIAGVLRAEAAKIRAGIPRPPYSSKLLVAMLIAEDRKADALELCANHFAEIADREGYREKAPQ